MEKRHRLLVNKHFRMEALLRALGVDMAYGNVYCPFHDDSHTGHKSAKFYPNDNSLYCWSCSDTYRPYEALKTLGHSDQDMLAHLRAMGVDVDAFTFEVKPDFSLFPNKDAVEFLRKQFIMGLPVDQYTEAIYREVAL